MTESQGLKIIEKMGPEAACAVDSWLSLQWTKFWLLDVIAPIIVFMLVSYIIFSWIKTPVSDNESEE